MTTANDPVELFRRKDDPDYSTIYCQCGAQFTWTFVDDRLGPWVEAHTPHMHDSSGKDMRRD
jgi:hypothetical protein